MHKSALNNGKLFFETYVKNESVNIVEIGSLDVNGSLRRFVPSSAIYTGVDFEEGNGVDIVLKDPYEFPFESNSVDCVLSSSCFEHSEFFWIVFLDIMRILKPDGLLYLNVPANGPFHRYPVDCWRFYPDAGVALQNWANRNNYNSVLLESYTSAQDEEGFWNDYVCVFLKDRAFLSKYPDRIIGKIDHYFNGFEYGGPGFSNPQIQPEDQQRRGEKDEQIAEYLEQLDHMRTSRWWRAGVWIDERVQRLPGFLQFSLGISRNPK